MPRAKKNTDVKQSSPPARTIQAREEQLIAQAVDLAARQLKDGTATSQVITHFLKLGTSLAQLEREKLENENQLLAAKVQAIQNAKDSKELYAKALKAMKDYNGHEEEYDADEII